MKKFLLFSFVISGILSPLTLSAQKKQANQPVLKTSEDTVSYALGVNIVQQGLQPYLFQTGVLGDTAAIRGDYNSRIANLSDQSQKDKLTKELKFKIDSVNKANNKNLEDFLLGFKQTVSQGKDKHAYNSGIAIGSQLTAMTENFSKEMLGDASKFNMDAFIAAFSATLKNEEPQIENASSVMEEAMKRGQEQKEAREAEELKKQYAEQIAEGDKFFADNKEKPGVITLPSGLQYKVIMQGVGERPTADDRVTVHYKGTLLDGTVFDSSYDRGEPSTFGVTQVIKGWTEALQLMNAGSKWELYIPYDLAYGSRSQGQIKPFSNLIFEVELIDIVE